MQVHTHPIGYGGIVRATKLKRQYFLSHSPTLFLTHSLSLSLISVYILRYKTTQGACLCSVMLAQFHALIVTLYPDWFFFVIQVKARNILTT